MHGMVNVGWSRRMHRRARVVGQGELTRLPMTVPLVSCVKTSLAVPTLLNVCCVSSCTEPSRTILRDSYHCSMCIHLLGPQRTCRPYAGLSGSVKDEAPSWLAHHEACNNSNVR